MQAIRSVLRVDLFDGNSCFVGNWFPLNFGKECNDHSDLSDLVENGESKTEPNLLIPLDLLDTLMLKDINVSCC